MSEMTDFERCRVCLVRGSDSDLLSLRENGGERAMFFEKFFGINLMETSQEALICESCLVRVDKVRLFIDNTRELAATHFETLEFLSTCDSDDQVQECRCCLSKSSLRAITERGPDLVPLLLMITGIDVQENQENVLVCGDCAKTLRLAELLQSAVDDNQTEHFEKQFHANFPEKTTKKKLDEVEVITNLRDSVEDEPELENHIRRNERAERRIQCNFCEYSSQISEYLIEHIANHLDPSKKSKKRHKRFDDSEVCLTCPICEEESQCVTGLEIHFVHKHLVKRKLRCDHCGWRCFNKSNMLYHIAWEHFPRTWRKLYNKKRRFECTFEGCKKRFKRQPILKQHMNTHLGLRFVCKCRKSYSTKYTLLKHQNTCHLIKTRITS